MNFNCVILDVMSVEIGNNCLLGPGVQIYAATHPVEPELRLQSLEMGKRVKIGNNVWLGGNSIVLPGVSIGDDTTIGAGSVVTKDIPARCVAAGNPCRIIRML
jgi:maltose O-acetyltransferase